MIVYRKANADEWGKLQLLNEEVMVDNSKYDPDLKLDWAMSETGMQYFQKLVTDESKSCVVAEENGKLIGYVVSSEIEFDYRNGKHLEINNMGVSPRYRNKGVCTELINEVLEWAKANGFTKIYVNSYFKNEKAIAFYKQNGFSEIDVSLERGV